ncbi:hypothetical protein HKD37_02G004783 [Glycine soja]
MVRCLLPEMMFCIGFDLLLMKLDLLQSDINTGMRGMTSFVLIGCERSDQCRSRKKDFVRRDTASRKCVCPFKLRGKPAVGGQGWMVKLIHYIFIGIDDAHDIFWCHPDVVKLCNAYNLVFLIDSTYKTNRYMLPLLDFVGVTPIGMTFSVGFAYLEGERLNNTVWTLEWFRGLFLRCDTLPGVIVTDRDLALQFHIDKNVKAKCKSLFDDFLKKFEISCSPWSMFVDYVNQTWIILHKEKFVKAGRIMIEYAHWALKRLLQNSLGDLCSVWEAMNNMITLQHTEIKAYFETSTHVVGYVFKVTLYRRLLDMISRYALNHIVVEFERVHYAGKNPSHCGCVMRTTHDHRLSEPQVSITEEMKTTSKRFEELDVNTKGAQKKPMNKHQRSTKCDSSYWEYVDALHSVQNSNSLVKCSASSSLVKCMTIILFRDRCPLPPLALLWSRNRHPQAKQWPTPSISRIDVPSLVLNQTQVDVPSTFTTKDVPSNVLRQRSQTVKPLKLCEWGYKRILRREESKEFSDCVVLNSLTKEKGDTKEFRRLVLRSFGKARRETQKEFRRLVLDEFFLVKGEGNEKDE